jgi:hypothetical protein
MEWSRIGRSDPVNPLLVGTLTPISPRVRDVCRRPPLPCIQADRTVPPTILGVKAEGRTLRFA